jgi:hypothetical protein
VQSETKEGQLVNSHSDSYRVYLGFRCPTGHELSLRFENAVEGMAGDSEAVMMVILNRDFSGKLFSNSG